MADWKSMAGALNLVNAFTLMDKPCASLDSEALKVLYLALLECSQKGEILVMDASILDALVILVQSYDAALHSLSRKTISDAKSLIDSCKREQASIQIADWLVHAELPPMIVRRARVTVND